MHARLGGPRVVSRALGCGARRRAACTPRRRCWSRPGSVACALSVQSRAIRQVITGSFSASRNLAGQWKPHNVSFFPSAAPVSCVYHTVPQALKLSSWRHSRYNSSRTSSSSFCDGHGPCICVCACSCDACCRPRRIERTRKSQDKCV